MELELEAALPVVVDVVPESLVETAGLGEAGSAVGSVRPLAARALHAPATTQTAAIKVATNQGRNRLFNPIFNIVQ